VSFVQPRDKRRDTPWPMTFSRDPRAADSRRGRSCCCFSLARRPTGTRSGTLPQCNASNERCDFDPAAQLNRPGGLWPRLAGLAGRRAAGCG
jgi:hypothetical protein